MRNRCMLEGGRVDTVCAKDQSNPIDERPVRSTPTQGRPSEVD